ncbi:hypothetical protein KSS87_014759 [Heliosperma pusillum]|nr:hypothetical protein KSS87_014759 [Heliosperma pusillum]
MSQATYVPDPRRCNQSDRNKTLIDTGNNPRAHMVSGAAPMAEVTHTSEPPTAATDTQPSEPLATVLGKGNRTKFLNSRLQGFAHPPISPTTHVVTATSSSLGDLKKLLAQETGLDPEDQRLFFRGREKDDTETLTMAGLKDNSKLLLMERPASQERKMEEAKKNDELSKAYEAIAQVRTEVDKLSKKVSSLETSVNSGIKVDEKEFIILTELLMVQLLKLDTIEAEGEPKVQRKTEVRRVQGYVDLLDSLKTKNANPFGDHGNTVAVTTNWETFDSGVGSLTPPSTSASPKSTQDWERFE